jgi:peptide chain release factor 2
VLSEKLAEVDQEAQDPDIWSDQARAREVMQRRSRLQQSVSTAASLKEDQEELEILLEMVREDESGVDDELATTLGRISSALDLVELTTKMTGEHDPSNAFLEIHPGAGGTESQDWAQMLQRLYLRWCERRGFETELIDEQAGEEAGIKSVTLLIKGSYAYGNLKSENGVHRLVRISPFDQQSRRHTSFASAHVYPEVAEDVDLEIEDKDLRVDRFCSSGPGGQGVNTTYSAVRVVHLPTGIIVTCQNERSQIKNLASAMKVLRARLFELEMERREEELDKIKGPKKEISWGNQIRSYVLQPYRMVKDLRTSHEVGDADRVLDGDIDSFIEAFLQWDAQKN